MSANSEFYEALTLLEKEKGIKKEYMLEKIKAAIIAAVKKEKNMDMQPENIDAAFDEENVKRGVRSKVWRVKLCDSLHTATALFIYLIMLLY